MLYYVTHLEPGSALSFVVYDEDHQSVLTTSGLAERNEPLLLHDATGHEYACVLEDLSTSYEAFDIYLQQAVFATIRKTGLPFLRNRYLITLLHNGATLTTQGDVEHYHYKIRRGSQAVARITSVSPDEQQSYQVSLSPEEDDLLLLSSIIVIDILSSYSSLALHPPNPPFG